MSLELLQAKILPQVETALQSFLESQEFGSSQPLKHMLTYHMGWEGGKTGGKRVRPFLTLLSALAFEGQLEKSMPAAISIELLHNFTLIHDDIEDHSPWRHGRATLWQKWGIPQAINAGDALFSIAQLAILDLSKTCNSSIALQASYYLNQVCLQLIRGQYLDIYFESDDSITLETYFEMIAGKTAALVGLCTALGGLTARQNEATVSKLFEFGESLGIAFQIRDDILGIWGDPKITGKSTASDILNRKKSFPILYGLEKSSEFQSLWTEQTITSDQIEHMAGLLEKCGAKDEALKNAESQTQKAFQILDDLFPHPTDENMYAGAIVELCRQLLLREL